MLDYTLPLTSEESAFAEKHHDVLLRYLRFHKLPVDEFYDIAVFGTFARCGNIWPVRSCSSISFPPSRAGL